MQTNDKIRALRERLQAQHLDAYLINTADPHQSEYVTAHYQNRAWLSGFTGSQGTALVTADEALLWADGRYFIQAEQQIAGSEFRLMKMDTPGYPSLNEWLATKLPKGARLGLCGELISERFYESLAQALARRQVELVSDLALVEEFWTDRPAPPSEPVFLHDIRFTGLSTVEKIELVRAAMLKDEVDSTLIAAPDDICWLFNFRGHDVPSNPVVLSYALISRSEAHLFLDPCKMTAEFKAKMAADAVKLHNYDEITATVRALSPQRVALNKGRVNRKLFAAIPAAVEVMDRSDYSYEIKACQNETELACTRQAMLRDSAVITSLMRYVKEHVSEGQLTEVSVQDRLFEMRKPLENFIEESFASISAYGPNGAMMHYRATEESHARLEAKSFFLLDCGSQFHDGTTDITRTWALGALTDEEVRDYTLTLKSHISLALAVWLAGTPGCYVDIMARQPLWRYGMDYKCGTGHGVGYVLGVHEGPQRFSKAISTVPLREGMVITNEPGVYKEGKYGIRLENDFVVSKAFSYDVDQFLKLDVLSFVPFDRDAIDPTLLNDEELNWLNQYHADCCRLLKPLLPLDDQAWLEKVTCPIER